MGYAATLTWAITQLIKKHTKKCWSRIKFKDDIMQTEGKTFVSVLDSLILYGHIHIYKSNSVKNSKSDS